MIFTAYLDEANTGAKQPNITVAAYLGSARQWRMLSKKLGELKRKEGFTSFHATEFKGRKDDFIGWSDAKASRLVGSLATAARDNLTEAVTISLTHAQYTSEYLSTPFPKGVPKFSQYGLCIYSILDRLVQVVLEKPGKNMLHLVVEGGHKNAGAAFTVFDALKGQVSAEKAALMGTVTLARKKECELLMFADFQAHASGVNDDRGRAGLPTYQRMIGDRKPEKGQAGLTFLHYEPGTLHRVKDRFLQQKEAKKQDYLKRKAAWLTSQKKASE